MYSLNWIFRLQKFIKNKVAQSFKWLHKNIFVLDWMRMKPERVLGRQYQADNAQLLAQNTILYEILNKHNYTNKNHN